MSRRFLDHVTWWSYVVVATLCGYDSFPPIPTVFDLAALLEIPQSWNLVVALGDRNFWWQTFLCTLFRLYLILLFSQRFLNHGTWRSQLLMAMTSFHLSTVVDLAVVPEIPQSWSLVRATLGSYNFRSNDSYSI